MLRSLLPWRSLAAAVVYAFLTAQPAPAENVLVLSDSAEIKSSESVLARPKFGDQFKLIQTKVPWNQVEFSADGRAKRGWIHDAHLLPRGLTDDQLVALQQALDRWQEGNEPAGRGDYQAALEPRLPAYETFRKVLGQRHMYVAERANALAILCFNLGDFAHAEPLYRQALEIKKAVFGEKHAEYALSLNNLAVLYATAEDYAQAEPLFRQALEIRKIVLGETHPEYARNLNNLALFYKTIGDNDRAEPLYRQALEIYRARLGEKHPDYAMALANLAILYRDKGEYARAMPLLRQALDIYKGALGEKHPTYADSLSSLAVTYYLMRDYELAEPLFRESLEAQKDASGENNLDYATGTNDLGAMYDDMGDHERAEPLLRQALEIREALLGASHSIFAASLNNLGVHLARREHWSEAADEFELARRATRRHVARVLPALSEKEQLAFLGQEYDQLLGKALSVALAQPGEANLAPRTAEWAANGKAVAHEVLAARALLARESADPAVAPLAQELAAARERLAAATLAVPSPDQMETRRLRLAKLERDEEELSKRLGQATGTVHSADPWSDLASVRQGLGPQTALIEVVRIPVVDFKEGRFQPPRYVAWVIPAADADALVQVVDLGDAAVIDLAVTDLRNTINDSPRAISALGEPEAVDQLSQQLRQVALLVLDPLLPHLGDATNIVLSPDASLWLVPWAALPLEDGRYAIEEYTVSYVISGRDLARHEAAKAQSPPMIVAHPLYGLPPQDVARRTAQLAGELAQRGASRLPGETIPVSWPDLPATEAEANAVASGIKALTGAGPTVYVRADAVEGVVKAVHRPRMLVLSTHGYFLPDQEVKLDERDALLAAADRRKPTLTVEGKPLANPLLRCGLVFAGANARNQRTDETADDGLLTGLEIAGMDLRGTELVVLSACETGLGDVRNGEGVAGLRQAFQLAGAQSVLATLWQIPDQETAQIMCDFFANLAAGQPKADALRNAQLATIAARRERNGAAHPLFWAAFTLTGN